MTMGDGNQSITAGGQDNTIRIGVGTSSIDVGVDGEAAGNESVTVGGGSNTIHAGGGGDRIEVQGGSANIVASGDAADVVLDAGSSMVVVQGASSIVNSLSGRNLVESVTFGDTFSLGSGDDTVWAAGDANWITAGSGSASITFLGQHDTIDVTHGTDTLIAQESFDTLILAAAGGIATQIDVNVIAAGDMFDLRTALGATSWDDHQSTLADYLLVRDVGGRSVISIDAGGKGPGPAADIAMLNNVAGLTYAGLIAQATLPPLL